ncbi:Arv1 protein [Candida orthopsilosis Co 90-125]|uniref:Protein ARV n=1 Tax=Candida orthopsilosis (strain 90-125) TaxID=1136231 RepID=H8X2J4_CANO9|nr:Arv1 protein [Candida orthopsilosis Co 90-125]CCG25541.1 Arv1 protein [Candida orthopsilosis Co 90-125]
MICIECGHRNIPSLYSKYKSEYVKLTVCESCNKICDKYIEYDTVILFLDILLLKKPAYRHLAYNLTEWQIISHSSWGLKYQNLIRLITLIILFDVYLTWATFERSQFWQQGKSEEGISQLVLRQSLTSQYMFFIIVISLRHLVSNFIMQCILRGHYGFGNWQNTVIPQHDHRGYVTAVLLTTIMCSGSVKLFRILTLIWPYDISIPYRTFDMIGFIYVIEALHVVTGLAYMTVVTTISVSSLVSYMAVAWIKGTLIRYIM